MKGMSFGEGTGYKSPQLMKKEAAMKMKKEAAMKMKKNSPMDKPLVGDQHKLPEHLKQKIEAAPTKLRTTKVTKVKGDKGNSTQAIGKTVAKGARKAILKGAKTAKIGSAIGTIPRKPVDPTKRKKAEITSPNKIAKRDARGQEVKMRKVTKRRSNSSDPFKILPAMEGIAKGAKNIMQKKLLQDNPPGSAGRKAAYDKLGWKYDDTVPGYNRDGTKKSTMTDPKKTDITGSDKGVNTKDYTTASTKGRKTTVVKTEGDKTATLVDTKRNIGDKRVVNITGPKGDIRTKTKFDAAGEQTKKKRKITLPDGTVIKVKSKRGGKRKVKIRKKGQLFGKRDRAREARLNEDLSMQPKN